LVEAAALVFLLAAVEISAFQDSTARALERLRSELENYRIVLVTPTALPAPRRGPPEKPAPPAPLRRPVQADPLERLDARMAGFVRDNPGLEAVVTRELAPDVDRRVLDLGRLLQKSLIRIRFRIDAAGRMVDSRVDAGSGSASVDHLALELLGLLEKYRVLAPMKGLDNLVASIRIEEDVEIRVEGEAADATAAEEIRKQVESVLALLRLALAKSEAAVLLQDVAVTASETQFVLRKSFEKDLLEGFLMELTGEKTEKPQPKP
jgi:hypothetical protein